MGIRNQKVGNVLILVSYRNGLPRRPVGPPYPFCPFGTFPLDKGNRPLTREAALSVTAHAVPAPPQGEPRERGGRTPCGCCAPRNDRNGFIDTLPHGTADDLLHLPGRVYREKV